MTAVLLCLGPVNSTISKPANHVEAMLNRRGLIASCERIPSKPSNIITKGNMEAQQNPNEPGKPNAPGQQGGRQQEERERQERERQQREREKQGGGGGQERGGGQQGGR
jgi:hypothetical protein